MIDGIYGLPALKAPRTCWQVGPDRVHQAACAVAAADRSAATMAGAGLESMVTPFWRIFS
jgi:hypothetical protein